MTHKQLLKIVKEMARKEKKINEFKRRIRAKGKVIKKSLTKNRNIALKIQKDEDTYHFVVIKTHKERFALAESLKEGDYVSIQGISRFRAIICTQLKKIRKPEKQKTLAGFLKICS